jgi:hypothetical protein
VNPDIVELKRHGINLDNFNAITYPSQPNHVATIGVNCFGLNHGGFVVLSQKASTIVDLPKSISWKDYMKAMLGLAFAL